MMRIKRSIATVTPTKMPAITLYTKISISLVVREIEQFM